MSKQDRVMNAVIQMLDDGYDIEEVANATGMPYELVRVVYNNLYEEEDDF